VVGDGWVIEAHEIEGIGERLRRALDDVLTELKGEGVYNKRCSSNLDPSARPQRSCPH
jgi:hypothetical protein